MSAKQLDVAEFQKALRDARVKSGLSPQEVEDKIDVATGWVERWEDEGDTAPPLTVFLQLLKAYGVTPEQFFKDLGEPAEELLVLDREVAIDENNGTPVLHFQMGSTAATILLDHVDFSELEKVMEKFRKHLSSNMPLAEAVATSFLDVVYKWPDANPSDLWYFLFSYMYRDKYNHPGDSTKSWDQSWRRTGGWALERIVCRHYNPYLKKYGVELKILADSEKRDLLNGMNISNKERAVEKADVLAVSKDQNGNEFCFGVVHVKASMAERRTDDVPLSEELISSGYLSSLVLMDCKAPPRNNPVNRGEFGAPQAAGGKVSEKRIGIEKDKNFDGAFSFNQRTVPTPAGQYPARIRVVNFADPDDAFSAHVLNVLGQRLGGAPPLINP